jgi:hypothetical protein
MIESVLPVPVTMRIPGQWSNPQDLIDRLPQGCRLTPESLVLPDGAEFEFDAHEADNQFAEIFRTSCRRLPTEAERNIIDNYTVNTLLRGPGGSLESARGLMRAASAIIQAGGAGVFVDNSGLSHGGENWLYYTDDGSSDAVSFAFVSIVRGKEEVFTIGMHILGLRDVLMKRADIEQDGYDIVEVIRYLAAGEKPVDDGHILADLSGPRFQAFTIDGDPRMQGSPMYNPFGRLRLVSVNDIAGTN